jgi:hypothetical protein
MSCGGVVDFRSGLITRIGDASLKFMEAMRREHCHTGMSHQEFTSKNYGVQTSPHNEWHIVVHRDLSAADMRFGRRVPDVKELEQHPTVVAAKLLPEEVVSVVLYTGYVSAAVRECVYMDRYECCCKDHVRVYLCMHVYCSTQNVYMCIHACVYACIHKMWFSDCMEPHAFHFINHATHI